MTDIDITERLRAVFCSGQREISECPCTACEAAVEITRLRQEADEERVMSNQFEMLAEEAAHEIERLTKERNQWQAEAAGISQDISNAEDEIEDLKEQLELAHAILASEAAVWLIAGSNHETSWREQLTPAIQAYWKRYGNSFKTPGDSDDIVARLRKRGEGCTCEAWGAHDCGCGAEWGETYIHEAADEIERLRRNNEVLQQALHEQGRANRMTVLYESATAEIQRLLDLGDRLAEGIRTGQYDDPLDAWTDGSRQPL